MKPDKSNHLIQLIPSDCAFEFRVRLNLPHDAKFIGRLNSSGDGTFYSSRNRKQINRFSNSLGVHYFLLTYPFVEFKWIIILLEDKYLVSTREYFLKYGTIPKFPYQRYSRQLFVPIEKMNVKEIQEYESKNRTKQILNPQFQCIQGG